MALIPTPVGGHKGELDVSARLTLERGKVEPNENTASFQKARWQLYTLGVGYALGDLAVFQDMTLRLEGTMFQAPAEKNDLARGTLTAAQCRSGKISAEGQCEFHPADTGGFLTPQLSFNVIHTGTHSFGFFLMGNVPLGIDYKRFVVPRTDLVAGGLQTGTYLTESFTFEARIYLGSGNFIGGKQNSTIAISNAFGLRGSAGCFRGPQASNLVPISTEIC